MPNGGWQWPSLRTNYLCVYVWWGIIRHNDGWVIMINAYQCISMPYYHPSSKRHSDSWCLWWWFMTDHRKWWRHGWCPSPSRWEHASGNHGHNNTWPPLVNLALFLFNQSWGLIVVNVVNLWLNMVNCGQLWFMVRFAVAVKEKPNPSLFFWTNTTGPPTCAKQHRRMGVLSGQMILSASWSSYNSTP